jgi:hypothetical protein
VVSQSAHFALFVHDYLYGNATTDQWKIYNAGFKTPNPYKWVFLLSLFVFARLLFLLFLSFFVSSLRAFSDFGSLERVSVCFLADVIDVVLTSLVYRSSAVQQ